MNYDTLFKSVLLAPESRLVRTLTGSPPVEQLSVEFPTVERRVPDLVCRLADGRILHMELQTSNDPQMAWRMLEYYLLLVKRFPEIEVVQFLLYVGRPVLSMPDRVKLPALSFHYRRRDIRDFKPSTFLSSPLQAERIFAILCRTGDPRERIRELLKEWRALPRRERATLLEQLVLASGLRGLKEPVRQEVSKVAIDWDEVIRENELIQELVVEYGTKYGEELGQKLGHEIGQQLGQEIGQQLGQEIGQQLGQEIAQQRAQELAQQMGEQIAEQIAQKRAEEKARQLLRQLIRSRFSTVPEWVDEKITAATADQVDAWFERSLTAASVEETFS